MYLLSLNVFIDKITCPGVWLCPNGDVVLKVYCLDLKRKTRRVYPKFPLLFSEELLFQKVYADDLSAVIDSIRAEFIQMELIQWVNSNAGIGVVLSKFNQSLNEILDICIVGGTLSSSCKIDLLMRRTDYFPGIISPKISTSVKLTVEQMPNYELPNSVRKKNTLILCSKEIDSTHQLIHQRPVCHINKAHHTCHMNQCTESSSFHR